jgi:hypothetical protein
MSAINQHIIKHTVVEMNFSGIDVGTEQQSEIRAWVDRLMEQLENDFDTLAPKDAYISMDAVSVELNIAGNAWKEEAIRGIIHKITDQVQLQSKGVISADGYPKHTPTVHFRNVFLSFLQFGYLPWHTKTMGSKQWQEAKENLLKQDEPLLSKALWAGIQQDVIFRNRLQAEVTCQAVLAFFDRHLKYLEQEAQKVLEDARLLEKSMTRIKDDKFAYKVFFAAATNDLAILKEEIETECFIKEKSDARKMMQQIEATTFKSIGFKHIQHWAAQVLAKENSADARQQMRKEKERSISDENMVDVKKVAIDEHNSEINTARSDLSAKEGIYISNAGLVIMAAFLPAFFTKLGYWKNGTWVKQQDAVVALQFLATAHPTFEEYDLVLPKLLCGMAPEQFSEIKTFRISKKIREESEALLASVIEYWSILKETSVEGLQTSFLQRDGKLMETEDAWMLWVEQKPFDMLLQHLPWNINMIKLPWMDKLLKTEWIY